MMRLDCDQVRQLIPAYVLGALERAEEAAVREHLAECDLHGEVAAFGSVVPYLADTLEPVEPPASLKARILTAAAADLEARRTAPADRDVALPERVPAVERPAPVALPTRVREDRRPRFQLSWGFALQAAAVIALVVVGAWNLNLTDRLNALEGDVAAARAYESAVNNVLAAAIEPGSHVVVLAPGSEAFEAGGLAAIRADGSVVLAMHDLDPTVGTEVYEAWVILGQDAPIPIGGFQVASAGTGAFTSEPTAAAAGAVIALTKEPGPDATAPTMPIISLGTALGPTS
jgi:hypothetical protein